jgi:hypothetical protein
MFDILDTIVISPDIELIGAIDICPGCPIETWEIELCIELFMVPILSG